MYSNFNGSGNTLDGSGVFNTLNVRGMESQITLVDTSAYGTPHTVLIFARDDMKNTRIFADPGRLSSTVQATQPPLMYSVETDRKSDTQTVVRRGGTDGPVVVFVRRRELLGDTIAWGEGGTAGKLNKWLRGEGGKWSEFPVSFECESVKYTWRANSTRQVALYHEDDPHAPIAWFQTSRQQDIDGVPTICSALLALAATVSEQQTLCDAVIVSLLVVEQGLRIKDSRYRAWGSTGRMIGGGAC